MEKVFYVLTLRASVALHTRQAPAVLSVFAHSESVEPVVMMSSTRRIVRPRTSDGSRTTNVPFTFSIRSSSVSELWRFGCPVLATALPRKRLSKRFASDSARSALWL